MKKRRSSRRKRKAIQESIVAPLGIGVALNMTPDEMMDEFFANSMWVSVFCAYRSKHMSYELFNNDVSFLEYEYNERSWMLIVRQ